MRDLNSNITAVLAATPAVRSASLTDAPIVDLQGAGSVTVVINTGAIVSSGNMTPSLLVGDAANLSDGVTATADELLGAFPTALAASSAYQVGYRGNKRYARVVLTLNSGTSVAVGALIVKGHLSLAGAV